MKTFSLICLSLSLSTLLTSCTSKTGTGVLAGGVTGAAIGGIAGGGTGALIGGAVGVVAGGLIGAALDNRDAQQLKEQSPETYNRLESGQGPSVQDVINMSQAGISGDKIIQVIQASGKRYQLDRYDIEKMQDEHVPNKVINFMIFRT